MGNESGRSFRKHLTYWNYELRIMNYEWVGLGLLLVVQPSSGHSRKTITAGSVYLILSINSGRSSNKKGAGVSLLLYNDPE